MQISNVSRRAAGIGIPLLLACVGTQAQAAEAVLNTGDTAFLVTCSLVVLLMTSPGLALFYGGLAWTRNVLSILTQAFAVVSMISVAWALYGYSLTFTDGGGAQAVIGGLDKVFMLAWFTINYIPMAHMSWGGGWLMALGPQDFAGGNVTHINVGIAALVGAAMLGKRIGYGAGLVAITPACGFVGPMGALAVGLLVSPCCVWAIEVLKPKLGLDDSFDVHGVGGIAGGFLTTLFALPALGGLGNAEGRTLVMHTGVQCIAMAFSIVFSLVTSFIAFRFAALCCGGLIVKREHEQDGLDLNAHGEVGYKF